VGTGEGGADQSLFRFGVWSLVAFGLAFAAAAYALARWFDWPLLATLVMGIGAGAVAAVLVARLVVLALPVERDGATPAGRRQSS
jgi:hypothetical protein